MMIERFGSISEFSRKLEIYLREKERSSRDSDSEMSLEEMDFLGMTREEYNQKTNSNNGRNDDYSKNDKIFNKKADANDIIDDFSEEYVVPGINFNDNNSEKEGFPSRRAYTMPLSKLFSLFHKYVLHPELLSSYVLLCAFI